VKRWIRRKLAAWFRSHADQIEHTHSPPHYPGTLDATWCRFAFNLREIAEQISNP
jgi:hypothetical protein